MFVIRMFQQKGQALNDVIYLRSSEGAFRRKIICH